MKTLLLRTLAPKFLTLLILLVAYLFITNVTYAAVAYDSSSESHTGTTGSTNQAQFSWNHDPVGTPKGIVVFVYSIGTGVTTPQDTGVTYGGTAMTLVSGGTAADTNQEMAIVRTYFLGSSVPTSDPAAVVVSRNNNATLMFAHAFSVTAAANTEIYEAGIVLLQENQAPAEQNVTDGSTGVNSVRFAGVYYGGATPAPAGANSTLAQSTDLGPYGVSAIYETTAGQGSRPVGASAASDDVAAVHLAIREAAPGQTISGVVYQTNESSPFDCSSSGPYTINLRVNGGGSYSTTCTLNTGAWSVSNVTVSSGQTIYAYVAGESIKASTVLVSDGTSPNDVSISVNRVTLRDDANASITSTEISAGNTTDADDLIAFSGSDLTVASSYETHITTGDTFVPGGNVTTGSIHVAGNYTAGTYTLTLTGTEGTLLTRTGTFTPDTSTTTVTSSSGTPNLISASTTFHKLIINSAATVVNDGAAVTIQNISGAEFTVTSGVFNFSTAPTGPGTGNGTLTVSSGAILCLGGSTNNTSATCDSGATTATTTVPMPSFQTYSFNAASTVRYLSDADTSIFPSPAYGQVIFSPKLTANRAYTFGGAATMNANFTANPTASSSYALTINMAGQLTIPATATTLITGRASATSLLDTNSTGNYTLVTGMLEIAAAGTLSANASTIRLQGTSGTIFTVVGTFNNGTNSRVEFVGDGNPTALTSGAIDFKNLALAPNISANRIYTFGSGAISTTGYFNIEPGGTNQLTVNLVGNVSLETDDQLTVSRTETATSLLVPGASNPTITTGKLSILTGGTLDGTGSTSNLILTRDSVPLAITGTFTPGTTTVTYAPNVTTGTPIASTTYYNLVLNDDGNTFSLGAGGITVLNDLTISNGVLDTVSGSNYPITIGRNWTNSPGTGGFLAQQGTVTFNTTATSTITGATNFYNFTSTTAGKSLKFGDATTFTINGLLTLTGSSGPNYVSLDSVSGGSTQWIINHQGTENITYTSVKNSACDGASTDITATDASNFDAGNNGECWLLPVAATPVVEFSLWKFDEGAGTTVNDSTSSSIDGTLSGTTTPSWQTEEFCYFSTCLYFEGTSAYLSIGDITSAKTVSFWVRPTTTTTSFMQLSTSAYITASAGVLSATGFTDPVIYVNGQPSKTIEADVWQHILVTSSTSVTASDVQFGKQNSSYFTGYMDEVKISASEFTDAQVKGDYAAYGALGPVSASFGGAGTQAVPVGYWRFDEGAGDTANDVSIQNKDGNLAGASASCGGAATYCPRWTQSGKYGGGVTFAASNSDFIELPNDAYDTLSEGSISFWIKPDDTGDTTQNIISATDGTAGYSNAYEINYLTATDSLEVWVYHTTVNQLQFSVPLPSLATDWHHVVITNDASGNKVYIDGQQKNPTYSTGNPSTNKFFDDVSTGTTYYRLGCSKDNTVCYTAEEFDGTLDEIKFFDSALNQDQVKLEFNQGKSAVLGNLSTDSAGQPQAAAVWEYCPPGSSATCTGPVGEWKMDEKSGTIAYDSSGNNNSGTLTNGPVFKPGKFGSAVFFDGASGLGQDDVINAGSATTIDDIFDGGGTISTWIKPASIGENVSGSTILQKFGVNSGWNLSFQPCNSSVLDLNIILENAATAGQFRIDCILNLNQWNHVVVVYNDDSISNDVVFYVNGIPQSLDLDTNPSEVMTSDNGNDLTIGNHYLLNSTFDGLIDDVRLYNYVRTSDQVAWEYNKGKPIAHYKLDECSGTTIYNSAYSSNGDAAGKNGIFTVGTGGNTTVGDCSSSGAWFNGVIGKRNGSLDFDDIDDVIAIADDPIFDFSGGSPDKPFSFATWIKMDDATSFTILGKTNNTSTGLLTTGFEWDMLTSTADKLQFRIFDASASVRIGQASSQALTTYENQWIHVAGTYDGSGSANGISLYLNGEPLQSVADNAGSYVALEHNTFSVTIGGEILSHGTFKSFANGLIDDVQIFNYELTPTQVKTIVNQGAIRFE